MILNCICKHDFQDKEHGPGRRVHNPKAKQPKIPQVYRCTVCGRERTKDTRKEKP